MLRISVAAAAVGMLASLAAARADTARNHDKTEAHPAADNTAVNKRDRDGANPTADQQKNDKSDLDLTAEIRRAIVKDKSLSTNAHNVKIIVKDGDVTLRGPVASREEKATVEKKAVEVMGKAKGKVTNELAIAP
jgi:osmotically-inducible protein OsmY